MYLFTITQYSDLSFTLSYRLDVMTIGVDFNQGQIFPNLKQRGFISIMVPTQKFYEYRVRVLPAMSGYGF